MAIRERPCKLVHAAELQSSRDLFALIYQVKMAAPVAKPVFVEPPAASAWDDIRWGTPERAYASWSDRSSRIAEYAKCSAAHFKDMARALASDDLIPLVIDNTFLPSVCGSTYRVGELRAGKFSYARRRDGRYYYLVYRGEPVFLDQLFGDGRMREQDASVLRKEFLYRIAADRIHARESLVFEIPRIFKEEGAKLFLPGTLYEYRSSITSDSPEDLATELVLRRPSPTPFIHQRIPNPDHPMFYREFFNDFHLVTHTREPPPVFGML